MARLGNASKILLFVSATLLFACSDSPANKPDKAPINPSFLLANGKVADPDYTIRLPQDHLSHPEFDIEWWYLTANLRDEFEQEYAFQWTLFRFSNRNQSNQWHQGQTFMAHTSLHSNTTHWFEEKFASGGLGNASVSLHYDDSQNPTGAFLNLMIDDWQWQGLNPDATLFPAKLKASVNSRLLDEQKDKIEIELMLKPSGPFVFHGENGYSVKSGEGKHASHYYSLPFIDVEATFKTQEGDKQLSGQAWYDHEWTSTLLDSATAGWDWMSLHLDNGDKLMAFSMRLQSQENYQTGTYITADGSATTLLPHQISLEVQEYTNVGGRELPLYWQVTIAEKDLSIMVRADKKNAYNQSRFPYYEGAVSVNGSHSGKGFLELTGY